MYLKTIDSVGAQWKGSQSPTKIRPRDSRDTIVWRNVSLRDLAQQFDLRLCILGRQDIDEWVGKLALSRAAAFLGGAGWFEMLQF